MLIRVFPIKVQFFTILFSDIRFIDLVRIKIFVETTIFELVLLARHLNSKFDHEIIDARGVFLAMLLIR